MTTPAPLLNTIPVADAARWAYRGTLAPNGFWYFAPVAGYPGPVLKLDPTDGSTSFIAGPTEFSVVGTSDGITATLDGNGRIYCAPYELDHDAILVIDTTTDTVSTIDVGAPLGQFTSSGGVYQPANGTEGAIFFPPGRESTPYGSAVKIDCATQTASFIDVSSSEFIPVWGRPILVGDVMYACENRFWSSNVAEQRVLRFNTLTETSDVVNAGIATNTDGEYAVELPGNRILFMPSSNSASGFIVDTDTFAVTVTTGFGGLPAADPIAPNGDVYLVSGSTVVRVDSTTGTAGIVNTGGSNSPRWSLGFVGDLFYVYDEDNSRVVAVDTTDDTYTATPAPGGVSGTFDTYTVLVPDTNTPGRAYMVPDTYISNETTRLVTIDAVTDPCALDSAWLDEASEGGLIAGADPADIDVEWEPIVRGPGDLVTFSALVTFVEDHVWSVVTASFNVIPQTRGTADVPWDVGDGVPPLCVGYTANEADLVTVDTLTGPTFSRVSAPGDTACVWSPGEVNVPAGSQYRVTIPVAAGDCPVAVAELALSRRPGLTSLVDFAVAWATSTCCPDVPLALSAWAGPGLWDAVGGDGDSNVDAPRGNIEDITTTGWIENAAWDDPLAPGNIVTRGASSLVTFPTGVTTATVSVTATSTRTGDAGNPSVLTPNDEAFPIGVLYLVNATGDTLLGFAYLTSIDGSDGTYTYTASTGPLTDPALLASGVALVIGGVTAAGTDYQWAWDVTLDIAVTACTDCPEHPEWVGAPYIGGEGNRDPVGNYADAFGPAPGWIEPSNGHTDDASIMFVPLNIPVGCEATVTATVTIAATSDEGVIDPATGGGLLLFENDNPLGQVATEFTGFGPAPSVTTWSVTAALSGPSTFMLGLPNIPNDYTYNVYDLDIAVASCCEVCLQALPTMSSSGSADAITIGWERVGDNVTATATITGSFTQELAIAVGSGQFSGLSFDLSPTCAAAFDVPVALTASTGTPITLNTVGPVDGQTVELWTSSGPPTIGSTYTFTFTITGPPDVCDDIGLMFVVAEDDDATLIDGVLSFIAAPPGYLLGEYGVLARACIGGEFLWEFSDAEWFTCREVAQPITVIGQLGTCNIEQYQVDLMARGGRVRVGALTDLVSVQYGRRLDAVSDATVVVGKRGADCCRELNEADPYATELRIWRNGDVVWEGPVHRVVESTGTVTIEARDVMHWTEVHIVRELIDDSVDPGRDATLIAADLLAAAFRHDDPGVLEHVWIVNGASKVTRKTDPTSRAYAYAELSSLAGSAIDWTVVGRRIIVMPTDHSAGRTLDDRPHEHPIGKAGQITHDDIVGDWQVIKDGRAYASRQITAGEGALVSIEGGVSSRYGLVERVNNESQFKTQAALTAAASDRYRVTPRPPVWVSLDDDVQLRPETPTTMAELVPGVHFDGMFARGCATLRQDFQLQRVSVSADAVGEQVSIGAVATDYADQVVGVAYDDIVVIGDSMTALNSNLIVSPSDRWVDILGASGIVGQIWYGATPGATTTTLRDAPFTDPRAADALVVFLGANDMITSLPSIQVGPPAVTEITPAQYRDGILWFIDNYPAPRRIVVFPWRWRQIPGVLPGNPFYIDGVPLDEGVVQEYREAARDAANTAGAAFVDLSVAVPTTIDDFAVDWIHPTAEGHRLIASLIAATL